TTHKLDLHGMAATEPDHGAPPQRRGLPDPLSASELERRLQEEIGRAERHGTMLSCLLVLIENLDALAGEHGEELAGRTLDYIAATLATELRRFDRLGAPRPGELAIVLPGADSPQGEVVARRVLGRVHTIKIESQGSRRPLELSVGLAVWRPEMSPTELIDRARAAAGRRNGEDVLGAAAAGAPDVRTPPPAPPGGDRPFGRAART
ncbi:MAG TPA: diguanylate cyclase, partial [Solirubrobacteraceae bacterium]|nr:diguanylate cyclase [Solirubrobacteraceae bacterium]